MLPQSDDYRYFQAIEAEFIRLRITPLQLSPDDFRIAKAWRAAGVPLALALETIGEKVAAQREKGQEVRRRLSYYRQAVLSAWRQRQELLAPLAIPAMGAEIDAAAGLEELAASLPRELATVAAEVRQLVGDPAAIEEALGVCEEKALEVLRQALGEQGRETLRNEVGRALGDLGHRLPATALAQAATSLERQLLRQRFRLPAFTLYGR